MGFLGVGLSCGEQVCIQLQVAEIDDMICSKYLN